MDLSDIIAHKPLLPSAKQVHGRWMLHLNDIDQELVQDQGLYAKVLVRDNPDILIIDRNDHRPFSERHVESLVDMNLGRKERGMLPI